MHDHLSDAANHQDWMEKMEDIVRLLDLLNQNLSGTTMVLASIAETLKQPQTTRVEKQIVLERTNGQVKKEARKR